MVRAVVDSKVYVDPGVPSVQAEGERHAVSPALVEAALVVHSVVAPACCRRDPINLVLGVIWAVDGDAVSSC